MLSWFSEPPVPPAPLELNLEIDEERIFTSFERITGSLIVKPRTDTAFDDLSIKLLGTSRTYGRRVVPQAPNARTVTTAHHFLELTQPGLALDFPRDRVLRTGRTYRFLFEFAIPDRMLPATCRHPVQSPGVHHLHTSMPPSFGDQNNGRAADYAPRNVSITYRVVAEATKNRPHDGCLNSLIAKSSKRVQFVPTSAPLALDPEIECRPIWEEGVFKKFWTRALGRITISSVQCTPFWVREPASELWNSHISGQVRAKITFYPECNSSTPPSQAKVTGILRSATTSAVRPLPQVPSDQFWEGPELDNHTAPSVILSTQAINQITWSQHSRHDSEECGDALPCYDALPPDRPTQIMGHRPYYSTEIVISLSAAIGFSLVPSFDTCLISKSYSVELKLSMQSRAIGSTSVIRFTVPVQLAVEQWTPRLISPVSMGELDGSLPYDDVSSVIEESAGDFVGRMGSVDSPPRYE